MPKFKMFRSGGKAAAIQKSIMNRQQKSVLLKARYAKLQNEMQPNALQRKAIDQIRVEYTTRQRELMEEYLQKEIDILEDLGNKYQIQAVDSQGNIIK